MFYHLVLFSNSDTMSVLCLQFHKILSKRHENHTFAVEFWQCLAGWIASVIS